MQRDAKQAIAMEHLRAFIDDLTLAQALKWAAVVLVAGFIGQFGRKFAEYLIEKAKRKKKAEAGTASAVPSEPAEKKEIIDKAKPESQALSDLESDPSKEAKELAKREKKLAKARAKELKKADKDD